MLSLARRRATRLLVLYGRPSPSVSKCLSRGFAPTTPHISTRTFLSLFKSKPKSSDQEVKEKQAPILTQDNLFHPFSKSPIPAIRARGEAIEKLAPCPVCSSAQHAGHAQAQELPKVVAFECPDCGWPTHCSREHWEADEEHQKYCGRLREVNEDEHDLRSGRKMREFELPGPQDSEAAISFANWDVFWYTREFSSMDSERSRRHASNVLTYPITIGSVLHQFSNLTLSNQRLTPEGSRSLAALRTNLHVPPGAPETLDAAVTKPQMRIFILGARGESLLPPHVWEQLSMLFPAAMFHLYFIGPQVSLPRPTSEVKKSPSSSGSSGSPPSSKHTTTHKEDIDNGTPSEDNPPAEPAGEKPIYVPNVYEPSTPASIMPHKRTRSSIEQYGVPSYTVPYTAQLTITGMQANYMDVHAQFQDTFDPYTDCFFLFSPGFGFPSLESANEVTGEPLLQIVSPTEWGPVIPLLLASKCPIFVTGFSPTDVERDVKSLSTAPEVAGEFDWVITPGPNAFLSEKWVVADFDPRVMVKSNWGVWGIRGKRREVRERSNWLGLQS